LQLNRFMYNRVSKTFKKFWASLALLSIEMLVILSIFFLSLVTVVFVIRDVFLVNDNELDNEAFAFAQGMISETNTALMSFITFFGSHQFLIPANLLLIAYYLFFRKHRWYSIKVPAVALSSFLLMFGLKRFFGRERPTNQMLEQATNFSFPSGHALMSVTFYGLIAFVLWNSIKNKFLRWGVVLLFLALVLAIGFTRIYLRKHYYSDVIAGYCIGFVWLVFALWFLNKIEQYSRKKISPMINSE
jgi:membrane-associated phospholipid phosphatase